MQGPISYAYDHLPLFQCQHHAFLIYHCYVQDGSMDIKKTHALLYSHLDKLYFSRS